LRAGEAIGGVWAGLFWYPCEDGEQAPAGAAARDISVQQIP
jgi:hypothetical protein